MTNSLPSGTVTFLFTDIEGSTKLAQAYPDKWETLRQRHHTILRTAIDTYNGYIFQIIGDAFCVSFNTASDAIHSAIKSQMDLHTEDWGVVPVKVRMGLHTGQAQIQENGDYRGYLAMSRVQRLMSAGHGGQILISMTTQELVRDELPENISLRDMGERRLKDLIRPEHIYQLDISGLPVDFPPLKTLDKYRHNLPTQLTSFIGREKEMAEVKQALAEHRLVTLTGSGGAGKTRLSLQVAADSLDQFPSGIWFVELAPLTDPDLIPQTILTAAQMQTQQGKSALESLIDFLREKTSLLVLDNCEHLIEACAKIADTLLNTAPNLKILASSREALGVKGEQSWRVPSLSAPDVKHLPPLKQLSQYEAVRLFIDRALLVQPHFAVTNQNAPPVAQICHRLDGIPLAIELAAARLRMLSAEQIAERLDDRFRLLTGGSRTALPRQQTLRALIDWSYDLLSENERTLLRRLAVFSGGCTLEAAEEVCSDDHIHEEDILDLLTHLMDKSLLAVDEGNGRPRYRLLETVRQYAREKLFESGEVEKLRTGHLAYFLKFAEGAESHLARKEQVEWLDKLEYEHENIRTALEWGVGNDNLFEAGVQLANALWYFWVLRDYWLEGMDIFLKISANSSQSIQSKSRTRALGYAGFFSVINGDVELASKLIDESINLCNEINDDTTLAFAQIQKGACALNNSEDISTAKSLYESSLSLYGKAKDKHGIALATRMLGDLEYAYKSDSQAAQRYYQESLELSRDVGDRQILARALSRLGLIEMSLGNLTLAANYFQEGLSLARKLGSCLGTSEYLDFLGEVYLGQGNYQEASKLVAESLAIARDLGKKDLIVAALSALGRIMRYQGDLRQARQLQTESLSISQESLSVTQLDIFRYFIAYSSLHLGELERIQGNYSEAKAYYFEALRKFKEGNQSESAYSLEEYAALSTAQGQTKRAAILFGAADALRENYVVPLFPVEKVEVDKNIAAARAQLDEASFNAAWAEGRAMSMEHAMEYALETLQA